MNCVKRHNTANELGCVTGHQVLLAKAKDFSAQQEAEDSW